MTAPNWTQQEIADEMGITKQAVDPPPTQKDHDMKTLLYGPMPRPVAWRPDPDPTPDFLMPFGRHAGQRLSTVRAQHGVHGRPRQSNGPSYRRNRFAGCLQFQDRPNLQIAYL